MNDVAIHFFFYFKINVIIYDSKKRFWDIDR